MRHALVTAHVFVNPARQIVRGRFAWLSPLRLGSLWMALAVPLLTPLAVPCAADELAAVVERQPIHHKLQVLVSSADLNSVPRRRAAR